ncbi:hypothetical protein [Aquimarina litoralis]|uniref:hypothetical protein n=1 Tax=Aquimarina litoralis TaxID=584605 RepID=UPI001C576DAF|nr:hypothetical protein [Aquimarina litoralis]MBW1294787.1 hypothetical protein [Aquimarina litoralis]
MYSIEYMQFVSLFKMLGGGGSIQGMITSLSNNKKLLRSKKLFKKERTFLNIKKDSLKTSKGKLNVKKASKEELEQIRKKIKKQKRKENAILICIAVVITSFMTYFTFNLIQENTIDKEYIQTLKFKEKEKDFLILIGKGDEWFEKGKWSNSIFYYKQAKEIFAKNYDINYRLVRSYSFLCENEFKNCHDTKELLENLFVLFPEKETELLKIKDKLTYEY